MTSRLPSFRLFTWLVMIGLSICAVANAGQMSPVRIVVDNPSPDHVLISIEIPTPTRDVVRTVQGIQDHWRIVGEQSLAIPGQPDVPVISRLVQVSESGWVEANILYIDEEVIPASPQGPIRVPVDEVAGDVEMRDSGDTSPNWTVRVSEPGIMGGIRIANLSISPVRYDPEDNVYRVVRRIQVSVDNVGGRAPNSIERTRPISPAFAEMAQDMVLNWYDSEPVYYGDLRGRYLIIAGDLLLSQMEPFAAWKQQKGYEVLLVGKSVAGNSNTNIRNYIQSVYESEGPPLSYVLLVGDCDGTQGIPEFTIESPSHSGEFDATDHPYSLLEGEDYFPDVFVGRLSTNTIDKVRVMVSKTVKYEKTPYTGQTDWFKSATVVAGNYAEGITPLTPVWTSMWIQEKFEDYGFIRVDTLFYRGPPGPTVTEILESINQGVSFVSYRGFADIHGWHYPDFRIENIDLLSNVNMTPIVTSIVCRTGDYCNTTQNPGFGEKWMVIGTYHSPKGAVAFIGATDLYTNTRFNNPLAAGFYTGVFDEQLPHLGQSLLRGKMELYNGFPTEHDYGEYCEFYFHVYNLLGDPELDVRTTVPTALDADHPTSVPVGASYVEVTARVEGGGVLPNCRVTLLKDSETHVTALSDESGTVVLPVTLETTGDLILTVHKHNSVPYVDTVEVNTETTFTGLYSVSYVSGGDEVVSPGELATVNVTLKNTGAQSLSGVTATLSTADTLIEITSPSTTYGTIAVGQTEQGSFTFLVDEGATHNHQAQMTLTVNATGQGPWTHNFWVPIWGSYLSVAQVVVDNSGNGILDPGETADISFTLANEGVITAEDFHIELSSWSDAITFPTTVANYPSIPVNQSASNSNALTISAAAGVTPGHLANLELAMVVEGDVVEVMRTAITIGDPDTTDPLGPDHYGYYAYDSDDQGYDEAPDYNWIELDPAHGGTGATPHLLADDASTVVGLPFTFTYYGQEFSEITICSNGWISFGETWMANFRNWHLPSALGPPNLVAGFWDDIRGHPVHPDTLEPLPREVWTRDDGNQFVIEWNDWYNLYGYSTAEFYEATFEIILINPSTNPTATGDGEIIVQYGTIENIDANSNFATVGIENRHHTQGLEYTFANLYPPSCSRLRSGLAIKFTTDPPDGFTGVEDRPQPVPNRIALLPGYPNPFNSQATFPLELSQREHVKIAIYNVMGQRVRSLRNQVMDAGRYRIAWDASSLSSGIYFVAMDAGAVHQVQKIVLLK